MAIYSIRTSRKHEIGLSFAYDTYADHVAFPTKEAYLQHRVEFLVLEGMYVDQQRATSIAFDQSFNTIPETEQPAAKTEIEGVITAHGGTVIPAGGFVATPTGPLPPPSPLPPMPGGGT